MSVSRQLIDALNQHSGNQFWDNPPDHPSFQQVLNQYAEYASQLKTEDELEALSAAFWAQIKVTGTPIIEELSNNEVTVTFLFPRNEYDHKEKKLYVSGDFHGFTSTNNKRQEMHYKDGTDIMYRSDNMPKDSVVIYHFFQAPQKYQDKNRPDLAGPGEALPESFYDIEPIPTNELDPELKKLILQDSNAKHWDYEGNIFCANVANDLSHIQLMKDTNWEKLLNKNGQHNGYLKNLFHRQTYLCDKNDMLHEANNVTEPPKLYFDQEHTRSVSVFEPRNAEIDHLILFHDGNGYMLSGAVERIDALIEKGEVPKNTAIICINTLLGLIEKYKAQSPNEFAESKNVRAIEYGTRIDDYVTFIDSALKQLGYNTVPAKNVTVIGGSMSGTASLWMGLMHKEKFGNVIAQAPSYSNRAILFDLVKQRKQNKKLGRADDLTATVKLSCGKFDSLENAQNLNLANTKELADILGGTNKPLPIHTGNYGHTSCCWAQELTEMLPAIYRQQEMKKTIRASSTGNIAVGLGVDPAALTPSASRDDSSIQTAVEEKREHAAPAPTNRKATDDSSITYSGYRKK